MKSLYLITKKILGLLFYIFIIFLGVVIFAEIWFRIEYERDHSVNKYSNIIVESRLWTEWSNKDNTDPLQPPLRVLSNTDIDNLDRLNSIVKDMSLPKNTTLESYDFLRPVEIKDQTSYKVTINNLGFRDPPRTVEKPKNAFRIIALGSYHTFGHGINDDEAYPRKLEEFLNTSKTKNKVFEVWNGGHQAATAIVGLAKLQTEILKYKPDLLIWDYGFVDPYVIEDDHFPIIYLFSSKGLSPIKAWLLETVKKLVVGKSKLFSKIVENYSRKYYQRNLENFASVNQKMLEITQKNNIPVILIKQSLIGDRYPTSYTRALANYKNAISINGTDIFKKYPPSVEVMQKFNSQLNWTSEFDSGIKKLAHWQPVEYFTDIYQYNKWGSEAIARYLADEISSNYNKK